MSELESIVAGLQITVLLLIASYLVLMHIKLYQEWKSFREMEARTQEALHHLEELSQADAKERLKNETGNP